jgi:hypothetical protein
LYDRNASFPINFCILNAYLRLEIHSNLISLDASELDASFYNITNRKELVFYTKGVLVTTMENGMLYNVP